MENKKLIMQGGSDLFIPLIAMLKTEFDEKSSTCIINCKNTLTFMKHFVDENNKNAVYISASRHPSFINDLVHCFRGKPQQKDLALRLYQEIVTYLINWYKTP
jgi:hypothetical protein